MSFNCEHQNRHSNAFLNLNGIPYVLAEYLDKNCFRQIDRSQIVSDVSIDQSESMVAVVDISIDDIGKRGGDGLPAVVGNNTNQKRLLDLIMNGGCKNSQLNVLKRGIIMRVNYRLENARTHSVLRSMVEDIRINDRLYFIDINPRNVNDNAIITNFTSSVVSTINQFTHGTDKMILRITNVQMFYECVKSGPKVPRIKQSLTQCNDGYPCSDMSCDPYYYHETNQHHHIMPEGEENIYGAEGVSTISPNTWVCFNRFYHFDGKGKDIIFHFDEINDPMTKVALIPCGTMNINRTFIINPGHRIIFKFSVWKNDIIAVYDTSTIANALGAPSFSDCWNPSHHPHHDHDHHHDYNPRYESMMVECLTRLQRMDEVIINTTSMLRDVVNMNKRQTVAIGKLTSGLRHLKHIVDKNHPGDGEDKPPTDCDGDHAEIEKRLDELTDMIDNLEDNSCECGEAMTIEEVEAMVNQFK